MSTKATIDGDDDFHLYREQADGSIRLRIDIKKKPLNIISPVICIPDEYVDIEIPRHVLKAILEKKDWFMKGWKHLHDDPLLEIISELHEKKKNSRGIKELKENERMSNRMTREKINEYLQKGCHVHIKCEDGKGNNRIVETIFVVEIPYHNVCNEVRSKLDVPPIDMEPGNIVVAARAFLSPRDAPNKRIPNEVVVGRIIRKIEEGRRGSLINEEIMFCRSISSFDIWLNMGLPSSARSHSVKKIAVFMYQDPECMKKSEEQVRIYKEDMESDHRRRSPKTEEGM